jgi:hypothetical protein
MKHLIYILVILAILFAAHPLAAQGNFTISVSGNVMLPADSDYKDVYGDTAFFPELKLSLKVSNGFYIWGGYGMVSQTGETILLGLEAKSKQHYISLGGGYNGSLTGNLEFFIDAGAVFMSYSEETMGAKLSDDAIGYRIDGSLLYRLGGGLLGGVNVGYVYATDTIEGFPIKIGGFKGGLTLAVRL